MIQQVREGTVPADLAGTYRDIRHTLRVGYVPLLFRALAAHRGALRPIWQRLRPNLRTAAFEEACDELRARLVTTAADLGAPLIEPVLMSAGLDVDDVDDVRDVVNVFHYLDPKLWLCCDMVVRALDGERVGGRPSESMERRELPWELPADLPELHRVPEAPGGVTGEIFAEILRTTRLPVATTDMRALAHWPSVVEAAWDSIAPVFRHPHMPLALDELDGVALELLRTLPYPLELPEDALGLAPSEFAAVRRVCGVLREAIPRLSLFAATLMIGLDGIDNALDSPFPIDWEDGGVESLDLPT